MNENIYVPHDIESEKCLLGSILMDKTAINKVVTIVDKDDFYLDNHKRIYNVLEELYNKGDDIDIVAVNSILKEFKWYQKLNGISYLIGLMELIPTSSHCITYANTIRKNKVLRDLIDAGQTITSMGCSVAEEAPEVSVLIEEAQKKIFNINDKGVTKEFVNVEDCIQENINRIKNPDIEKSRGVLTGFNKLDDMLNGLHKSNLVILAARPAQGKALDLNTKILTNNGWVKNKDIKIGDKIIGDDGKETSVVGVFPQGVTKNYKITFMDGREQVCCEKHLWKVDSCKLKGTLYDTKFLYKKLQRVRYQGRISIPLFEGDYGEKKNFIIPPYVLGVLIGDGCLTRGGLSYSKPNEKVFLRVKENLKEYDVRKVGTRGMVSICGFNEGIKYIKEIGLKVCSYDKFIPEEYMHSSKEQRQELFQGLMDTDGYRSGEYNYEYSTTSKRLALEVQQLAFSLGYRCRIISRMGRYKKDNKYIETRINYRVFIGKGNNYNNGLTIKKIEEVEPSETQCLMVDNASHLFVIENYVVTHNSSLAMDITRHASLNCGKSVAFFSLEMSKDELIDRLISSEAKVNSWKMRTGLIEKGTQEAIDITEVGNKVRNSKLFINDTPNITVLQMRAMARKLKAKSGLDLIVVDYLQLIQPSNPKANDVSQMTEISRQLKIMAKELNVPVLALSQLSRAVESRIPAIPRLSDLRTSGSIEQDADVVMFIYREELYKPDTPNVGLADIIIAKHRSGAVGKVRLAFKKEYTSFENFYEY